MHFRDVCTTKNCLCSRSSMLCLGLLPKSSWQFKNEMNVFISNHSNKESNWCCGIQIGWQWCFGGHLKDASFSFFYVTVPFNKLWQKSVFFFPFFNLLLYYKDSFSPTTMQRRKLGRNEGPFGKVGKAAIVCHSYFLRTCMTIIFFLSSLSAFFFFQSSCTIDVTYFPFDQQTCIMKFGSWTFTGDQVSLTLYNNKDYVDLSDYWKSGTWDIIEVPAYLNVHNASSPNMPTETDITFYITIRRKTLFYTVNLILPTVLISFLCVLVFYLPAEAGEKVTLGISILLSLVVFLLLVSKILPPTSLVLPLIAKYLLFTFIMNTVSILVTVVIINWNFRYIINQIVEVAWFLNLIDLLAGDQGPTLCPIG